MTIIEKISKSPYKSALIMVLITVIIHCLAFYQQNIIQRDSIYYIGVAKELINPEIKRQFSNIPHEPLLPMMIAVGHRYGLTYETAGILFVIIMSSFLPLAIFMIAKEVFKDNIPALLAAMLASIQPYCVMLGSYILRDVPYWTYLTFAIAFLLIAIRERTKHKHLIYWAIAGAFSALAIAIRKEGVELILFVILWFPVQLFLHRAKLKEEFLRVALSAIVFLVATSIVCGLIYYYYTIHLNGTWSIIPLESFAFLSKLFFSNF